MVRAWRGSVRCVPQSEAVQSGAPQLPQSRQCPRLQGGDCVFWPGAASRESTREKKQARRCVRMVLGSLGRRNRQGEIHLFRDETRKGKCLRKSSAEVAFPVIPLQREQELAAASQAAPLLPAARPRGVLLRMAEGGRHVSQTEMSLPPLLHPGPQHEKAGGESLARWVVQDALDVWGPKFHLRAFPSRNAADSLPSVKPAGILC